MPTILPAALDPLTATTIPVISAGNRWNVRHLMRLRFTSAAKSVSPIRATFAWPPTVLDCRWRQRSMRLTRLVLSRFR